MITGTVTADNEAIIRLTVRGFGVEEHVIEAVVDTGYTGTLTLPIEIIRSLGLRWRRSGRAILADGSEVVFDVYDGIVLWDSSPRRIIIDAADADPLVGMALLRGHRLTVDVIGGGNVTIERLPRIV